MHYPDSPEGVAFGLMLLILGAMDPTLPPPRPLDETETLKVYMRCLKAVQGQCPILPCEALHLRH